MPDARESRKAPKRGVDFMAGLLRLRCRCPKACERSAQALPPALRGLLFGRRYLGCDDPKRSKNNSKLPRPSSPRMTACSIRNNKKLGAGHRFPDGSSPEIRLRNKLLELRLLDFQIRCGVPCELQHRRRVVLARAAAEDECLNAGRGTSHPARYRTLPSTLPIQFVAATGLPNL